MSEELNLLMAERAIQRVLTSYSRGVDRFERRDGQWRIRKRVCAYDWRRTDRVGADGGFADTYVRDTRSADDIDYHILDE
jgi:hypothetical protein